jgi:hypothetical protein
MRDPTKSQLTKLARQLGAKRPDDRIDWFRAFKILAAMYYDFDYASSPPRKRSRKQPTQKRSSRKQWRDPQLIMLYRDVRVAMERKRCGVLEACRELSQGRITYTPSSQDWTGVKPQSLRQRYFEAARKWRKASK